MADIGIFGGSFDPIHFGHLILAERCRDRMKLDQVIFVPAYRSPLKSERPAISDEQRVDLLKLATTGNPDFGINLLELQRQEVSYTVDTLTHLKKEYEGDQLYFLLGSDSLADFTSWRSPSKICELAKLLVINWPGLDLPDFNSLKLSLTDSQINTIKENTLESPLIEISSSTIRNRLAIGESIRYLMPSACEKFIQHKKLYQK